MTTRTYASPEAFKRALEQRLRSAATAGTDLVRRRQLLVFDRFLARLARELGNTMMLKGGLALELRLERARTTKDVDLRMAGSPDGLLDRLQEAGRLDLGDFLAFEILPHPEHPEIEREDMPYNGLRFRVEGRLAGKRYGEPFGLDVAFADAIFGEPDELAAEDVLDFIGVPPPVLRVCPIETHIAEKVHAYTLPRQRVNSRVKDLPDLALLATIRELDLARVRRALEQTFAFRGSHPLPSSLPDPPATWTIPYAQMAAENALRWQTLDELVAAVRAFLDIVLEEPGDATWSPAEWRWRS